MAFGKRPLPQPAPAAVASPISTPIEIASPAELTDAERHQAMREIMLGILGGAGRVAEAVRSNGMLNLTGIAEEIDPTTAPIELRELKEQFTFLQNGAVVHPFYCYTNPAQPGHVDPSAQFQIYELVRAARDLNVFCQEAERDEALAVALQTPLLPALVDQILASASFFAAYFDCLTRMHALTANKQPVHDLATLKRVYDHHKLMATDLMVVPETYDALAPQVAWPHIGIELLRQQEGDESFVSGVYFPAEYANRLAESTNTARLDALRARN